MISYKKWDSFCKIIAEDISIKTATVKESILVDSGQNLLVIKHDIEALPERALDIAIIENKHKIKATYYFHGFFLYDPKAVEIICKIQKLGHEIGYHYDVLDIHNGNYTLALAEFERDLMEFNKIGVEVVTICPHGNPLKKRTNWNSNKDFFKSQDIRIKFPNIFDVVNDINHYSNYIYISDAGYKLKLISDIKDNDKGGAPLDSVIRYESLPSLILENKYTILSVHTHRLNRSSLFLMLQIYTFISARFLVNILKNVPFFNLLFSKLFKFSKRF